ncbi:MAG: hypothetical protein IKP99_03730 [Bacteroidales bacterium]|nr:hypothetical protein [Bacteroidales bacterium]MBR4349813.1 hypothetical protein [Bacteroidales bacterium]
MYDRNAFRQTFFICGHSLKDMGKKLTAIMLMETKPEMVIGAVKCFIF